jgi:hypothetical protein
MGGERPTLPGDERLECCGHARRMHEPTCTYWFPGTRDEPPRLCGCGGTGENGSLDRPDVAG